MVSGVIVDMDKFANVLPIVIMVECFLACIPLFITRRWGSAIYWLSAGLLTQFCTAVVTSKAIVVLRSVGSKVLLVTTIGMRYRKLFKPSVVKRTLLTSIFIVVRVILSSNQIPWRLMRKAVPRQVPAKHVIANVLPLIPFLQIAGFKSMRHMKENDSLVSFAL